MVAAHDTRSCNAVNCVSTGISTAIFSQPASTIRLTATVVFIVVSAKDSK
jgi:hypothetical protein